MAIRSPDFAETLLTEADGGDALAVVERDQVSGHRDYDGGCLSGKERSFVVAIVGKARAAREYPPTLAPVSN